MFVGLALSRARMIFWLLVCAVVLFLPTITRSTYLQLVFSMVGTYVVFGLALNLFWGHCGQISFGHQGLFAVGAYASVLLARHLDLPFFLAVVAGGLSAAVVSAVVGLAILRLRGVYLALGTFALGMALYYVFDQWTGVTNGISGLAVPTPMVLGHSLGREGTYWVIAVFSIAAYLACYLVVHSRVGRAFHSIRDDEVAAAANGINVFKYRLMAFGLSAFLAGLAGGLYSYSTGWIASPDFGIGLAMIALTIVVVGGLGSDFGQMLGGAFVVFVPELLSGLQQWSVFVYGASLGLVILFLPEGLHGGLGRLISRIRPKLRREVATAMAEGKPR